jgi:hypothetical protein
LGVGEESDNIFVGFAKLGAVAFVKDKHNALISEVVHCGFVLGLFDGGVKFLDGGDDEAAIACHLVDELFGVVGAVYAVGAKVIKFFTGLVVKIGAINDEQYFMDFRQFFKDLGGFEAGEGFP